MASGTVSLASRLSTNRAGRHGGLSCAAPAGAAMLTLRFDRSPGRRHWRSTVMPVQSRTGSVASAETVELEAERSDRGRAAVFARALLRGISRSVLRLRERFGDRLTLRVSIDHYSSSRPITMPASGSLISRMHSNRARLGSSCRPIRSGCSTRVPTGRA